MIKELPPFSKWRGIESGMGGPAKKNDINLTGRGGRFPLRKSGNFIIFINEILTSARPRSFRVRLNLISRPANLKQ